MSTAVAHPHPPASSGVRAEERVWGVWASIGWVIAAEGIRSAVDVAMEDNSPEEAMSNKARARPIRLPILLAAVCCVAPAAAFAQDEAALKDAIQCKDFKHNSDGSWYADGVTLNYGPGKSDQKQVNLFGATIKKGQAKAGEPDLWVLLNDKCGTASH